MMIGNLNHSFQDDHFSWMVCRPYRLGLATIDLHTKFDVSPTEEIRNSTQSIEFWVVWSG